MPPRKPTASAVSATPVPSNNGIGDTSILSTTTAATAEPRSPTARKGNRPSTGGEGEGEKVEKKKSKNDDLGIDDLLLPRTLTSRLSRGTLPPNTSIQRDALLALTKSATVFISYLGHTANSLTSRKTIQTGDVLEALRETGLWDVRINGPSGRTLGDRVQAEVEKWEDEIRGKRKGYRDRVRARESGGGGTAGPIEDSLLDSTGTRQERGVEAADDEDEDDGRGPLAKRARRSSAADTDATMDVDGDAAAAAQLRSETVAADRAHGDGNGDVGRDDTTEIDPEVDADEEEQDEEEQDVEDDEQEQDDEDDDEEDENQDDEDDDNDDDEDDNDARRDRLDPDDPRRHTTLAPNGRVEVGSDEESD